ncbi:thioredoxin-like negative regulator of GroEL [Methanomicrobium sp. W14]|uniref:thioredoxin family protein n=1 Tax=Methanomicrobium sp. W14 TaxID=2817839 RepID=UPI001FDA6864|nr:thioredoxin family protein [Methanomicrobium sp. W14]MBP2132742.1 thioredoxin-like negative regulator of GroEL [Methanomicrobium sp. W14]
MEKMIADLKDLNWETKVEKSIKPVFVMFYSDSCSHCRNMMPFFEKMSEEYRDVVIFGRLDVDKNVWIRERYGIMSTPTFKFYCRGKPVADIVGEVYPAMLRKMVDDMIENGHECAEKSSAIDYEITGYA